MNIQRYIFRFLTLALYTLIIFCLGLAFLPLKDAAAAAGALPEHAAVPGWARSDFTPANSPQAMPARDSLASLSAGNSFNCAGKERRRAGLLGR